MLFREPPEGFNIRKAEGLQKSYIYVHLIVVSIWYCLVALVSNFLPTGCFPHKKIDGQNILVTGAANGLGREMTLKFAGYRDITLILWDRDEVGLKRVKKECEKRGAKVQTFLVDMSKSDAITSAAERVLKEIGRVDILINNAGIGIGGKILEISEEDIRRTFEINCLSHYWMLHHFLPAMYARNSGHIVSTVSMSGIFALAQDLTTYGSSKFAALGLMEGMENEAVCLGKDGIRFTSICPGYFQSPLMASLTSAPSVDVMTAEYVASCAVDAILRELRIVFIPRGIYGLYILKGDNH